MTFFTDIRDKAVKIATLGCYDPAASRQAEREQRHMITDQINAYKEQTELTRQQLNQARQETEAEKRRVQEKQIRTLRRNYRAAGASLLGQGQPAASDMNSKLGG